MRGHGVQHVRVFVHGVLETGLHVEELVRHRLVLRAKVVGGVDADRLHPGERESDHGD